MPFTFKFAHLQRLAIHEEDQVKKRLAIKDGQIAEVDKQLGDLKEKVRIALDDKVQDLLEGNMAKVRMYMPYLTRLDKERDFHLEERSRLANQREKILLELAEKRQVRKTYDKLQDRHAAVFKKTELKRDQKRMDDFAGRAANSMEGPDDHA
jgi:flagellar export protein FliJ